MARPGAIQACAKREGKRGRAATDGIWRWWMVVDGGGGGSGGGGGGTRTSEREVLLPRRRGCDACTSWRRAGRAGKGRAVPGTARRGCLVDAMSEHGFHTQHTQAGVPHQPEPEPEALLRRGPLADGAVPLEVLSSIGAKWGQGFLSSA